MLRISKSTRVSQRESTNLALLWVVTAEIGISWRPVKSSSVKCDTVLSNGLGDSTSQMGRRCNLHVGVVFRCVKCCNNLLRSLFSFCCSQAVRNRGSRSVFVYFAYIWRQSPPRRTFAIFSAFVVWKREVRNINLTTTAFFLFPALIQRDSLLYIFQTN